MPAKILRNCCSCTVSFKKVHWYKFESCNQPFDEIKRSNMSKRRGESQITKVRGYDANEYLSNIFKY